MNRSSLKGTDTNRTDIHTHIHKPVNLNVNFHLSSRQLQNDYILSEIVKMFWFTLFIRLKSHHRCHENTDYDEMLWPNTRALTKITEHLFFNKSLIKDPFTHCVHTHSLLLLFFAIDRQSLSKYTRKPRKKRIIPFSITHFWIRYLTMMHSFSIRFVFILIER